MISRKNNKKTCPNIQQWTEVIVKCKNEVINRNNGQNPTLTGHTCTHTQLIIGFLLAPYTAMRWLVWCNAVILTLPLWSLSLTLKKAEDFGS